MAALGGWLVRRREGGREVKRDKAKKMHAYTDTYQPPPLSGYGHTHCTHTESARRTARKRGNTFAREGNGQGEGSKEV